MNSDDRADDERSRGPGWDARGPDPLIDQLRREADAQRPAFSPALHRRTLERIDHERRRLGRPRSISPRRHIAPAAAAAAVLVAIGMAAWWYARLHDRPAVDARPQVAQGVQTTPTMPKVSQAAAASPAPPAPGIDCGGILFARLWPPAVTVRLPATFTARSTVPEPAAADPAPSRAPERTSSDLPQWLLARLREPPASANKAIADLLPPAVRPFVPTIR